MMAGSDVRTVSSFVRTDEDPMPSVFVREPRPRGRPPVRYRALITTPEGVETARKSGVPVYLLDPRVVTALGYPMDFHPELVVARSVLGVVDTSYRIIPFRSEEAVIRPRLEDIALALLSINRLAARAVLDRNRDNLDADYLLKRVLQEELSGRATTVRFFDVVPALPRVGRALPKDAIERQLRKNPSTGRLP
jgi:hypothetical protein